MKAFLSYLLISFLFLVKGYGAVTTPVDGAYKYGKAYEVCANHLLADKSTESNIICDCIADDEENDDEQTQEERRSSDPLFYILSNTTVISGLPVRYNRFSYTRHFAYLSSRKFIFQRVLKI